MNKNIEKPHAKLSQFERVIFVPEYMPAHTKMEHGVLYVSRKYKTANHLCACGCGEQTVTPLNIMCWNLQSHLDRSANKDLVTLAPSILNKWCDSHYWVRDNQIVWC